MKIIEPDFKIEYKSSNYVLYLLKTKKEIKELKEDVEDKEFAQDLYKVKGYYTSVFNAITAALKWRMSKKYPFKELPFKKEYTQYRKSMIEFDDCLYIIYEPIIELKLKMYNEHRQFLSRISQ